MLPDWVVGFKIGTSTNDVTGCLRQILQRHHEWDDPFCVGSTDIEAAFDSIDHVAADEGHRVRGTPLPLRLALLESLVGVSLDLYAGSFKIAGILFFKGGRQGHTDTANQWNVQLTKPLIDLAMQWRERGLRLRMEHD